MLAHALYLCRLNENITFVVLQYTMTLSFNFCLLFSAPEIEDREAYCLSPVCHSVIPLFCHSLWNFKLAKTFEHRLLELWYFTWVFLVMVPFRGFQYYFYPVTLEFDPFFKTLNLLITFDKWVLELWYFTCVSIVIRPFRGFHYFFPCDLYLGLLPNFWKLEPCSKLFNSESFDISQDYSLWYELFFWVSFFLYPVTVPFEFNPLKN